MKLSDRMKKPRRKQSLSERVKAKGYGNPFDPSMPSKPKKKSMPKTKKETGYKKLQKRGEPGYKPVKKSAASGYKPFKKNEASGYKRLCLLLKKQKEKRKDCKGKQKD
jgi:hypothetical protein